MGVLLDLIQWDSSSQNVCLTEGGGGSFLDGAMGEVENSIIMYASTRSVMCPALHVLPLPCDLDMFVFEHVFTIDIYIKGIIGVDPF